ncbi:MAG: signal peptidase II [Planctomycetota bacterium]
MSVRYWYWVPAVTGLIADLVSKQVVFNALARGGRLALLGPWLVLRLQKNRGGVFGIFQGKGFIFVILTAVALGFVAWMVCKAGAGQRRLHFALGLVTAGALGNLCDRLFLGYVRDFIYIEAINYPAFNLADACICVAAVLLFIEILRDSRQEQGNKA